MNFTTDKKLFFLEFATISVVISSVFVRLNYQFFVQNFGLLFGDLFYFYKYYSSDIYSKFFYPIEYPVGYVIIQKVVGFISMHIFQSTTWQSFILAHLVLILPSAFVLTLVLYMLSSYLKTSPSTAIGFLLLSPTFFLASTHNYELFVLAFMLPAILFLIKNRYFLSSMLLAYATAIKIFPGLLLPLFLLYVYNSSGSIKKVAKFTGIFIVFILIVNLPFYIYSPFYWKYAYLQQKVNIQQLDPNTITSLLHRLNLDSLKIVFMVSIIIIAWILCFVSYKRGSLNPKSLMYLAYLICFSAVFANHVNTPQYLLWFLPFAAVLNFPSWNKWIFFDIFNSLILYFYFILKHPSFTTTLHIIYLATPVLFLIFYLSLIMKVGEVILPKGNHSK